MRISKEQQTQINSTVENEYFLLQKCFGDYINKNGLPKPKPLFHCNARYYCIDNYIVLESYNTIIAFIIIDKQYFVDCLRFIYGYTATSVQHMSKFKIKFLYEFNTELSWRDIK